MGFSNIFLEKSMKSKKPKKNAAPISISDCLLGLFQKEHPTEHRNFLENKNISDAIKSDLMCLFEAQMILKVLHKHLPPIDVDIYDIKEYITRHLKPHVKEIAGVKLLKYSPAAKDAAEALNMFDLNNFDFPTKCKEEVLNRFLNTNLLNKDGTFNTDYIPEEHSKDVEETSKRISVSDFILEQEHRIYTSEGIWALKWAEIDQEGISKKLFKLYEKYHPAEYKQFLEDADMSQRKKAEIRILIEAQMILKVLYKQVESLEIEESEIFAYIAISLGTDLASILEEHSSSSMAAKDAVEILGWVDLVKKNGNNPDSESIAYLILLVISIGIGFVASSIVASVIVFFSFGTFLYYRNQTKEYVTSFKYKDAMEKAIKGKGILNKKRRVTLNRFLNVNLMELDKAYPLTIKSQTQKPNYENALESQETLHEPDKPLSEKHKKLMEFYTDQTATEEKDYRMYSHDFPHGKEISAVEFQRRKDEFDPGNERHSFFIFQEGEEYYNKGIPLMVSKNGIIVLRLLLKNSPSYVMNQDIFNTLTGANLTNNNLRKGERGHIHKAIQLLKKATYHRIDKHIIVKPLYGYKFDILEEHFFYLMDKQ